ncbi:MAG: LCP family protein [Candidatus Paceibacterota bacterium]|jgi:LCP family protein required for cell wall assembly
MKATWKYFFIFFAAAFLVGGTLGFIAHVPGRTVVYAHGQEDSSNSGGSFSDFLSRLFHKSPISMVIFGVAGSGHNGAGLTDTIVMAYFNPDKNRLSLISIPRDLWVSDGTNHFKINEALGHNKLDVAFARIGDMTGIVPHGYMVIDLDTVRGAVDDLGGVDIVLSQPATDWVSGYTMAAGMHHLTGDDAVWLIRNRYAPNGDFFREQNQQNIVKEAFAKFERLSAKEKALFAEKYVFQSNALAHANIDVAQLAPYVLSGGMGNISMQSITFDFSTKLLKTDAIPLGVSGLTTSSQSTSSSPSSISVLVPTAGMDVYEAMRAYVQARLAQ